MASTTTNLLNALSSPVTLAGVAPVIEGLNGDAATVSAGVTVFLDLDENAVVTDADNNLVYLSVFITDPTAHDVLDIAAIHDIWATDGLNVGSTITIGDVVVGTVDTSSNSSNLTIALSDTATPALVQTVVRALMYTNTDQDLTQELTRTIMVTLDDADGNASENMVSVTVVQANSPENTAPVIEGDLSRKTVYDTGIIAPFADLVIVDDSDSVTVTITLDDKSKGTFHPETLEGWNYDPETGACTITGTSDEVQAAVKYLHFMPTERADAPADAVETTTFTIKVSDGEFEEVATLELDSLANDEPTDITLDGNTVQEYAELGTLVGTFSTTDANNGQGITYQLLDDAGWRFTIVDNKLYVLVGDFIDYEQHTSHQIKVLAIDEGGLAREETFTINVTDIAQEHNSGSDRPDSLEGGSWDDWFSGGIGDDDIWGDWGNDDLWGDLGDDDLWGGWGDDDIWGGLGADDLWGDWGNDDLWGDAGDDDLFGGDGDDKLDGGDGDDVIEGGKDEDTLIGGAGDDEISGGYGDDVMTGGAGHDAFVFDAKAGAKNSGRIKDFKAKDDSIWLENGTFKKLGTKGTEDKPAKLNAKFFTIGDKAKDKNDYVVYDKKKGVLYYDADGSGAGKALEIAKIDKKVALTAADFFTI